MAPLIPARLEPFFSPRIWGVTSLAPFFPEKTNLAEPIGEAWLTARNSLFADGPFVGKTLQESWAEMPIEWRGRNMQKWADFPVLVKFLFPNDKLSIQVHPDDTYASRFEKSSGGRGKTEMWHIVSAEPDAALLIGLKPGTTREKFLAGVSNNSVEDLLVHHTVRPGETYFVPAGTQHAILPHQVICEIQEYSDLTYRVSDFGRTDASGSPRALHIEKAMAVSRFGVQYTGKMKPVELRSDDAEKHLLAACAYFATERWEIGGTARVQGNGERFQLLVFLQGSGQLVGSEGQWDYRQGEAWFVPAALPELQIQSKSPTTLLRIYLPNLESVRMLLMKHGYDEQTISQVVIG